MHCWICKSEMPKIDTTLEALGAEFFVLGKLLLHGISAYKAYDRQRGYDLVCASNTGKSLTIQVKTLFWAKGNQFSFTNFESDFTVLVRQNRVDTGKRIADRNIPIEPQCFVIRTSDVKRMSTASKQKSRGHKLSMKPNELPMFEPYKDKWKVISANL